LAIDPFDSSTLYAAVGAFPKAHKAGLYVTHDAGKSWRHLSATQRHKITFRKYRNVDSIAPDPSAKGTLLAGSAHNGLWRSTDAGRTWRRVLEAPSTRAALDMPDEQQETPMPYRAPVSVVVFDPKSPKTVYAGLYGGGVFKSTRSGAKGSWKPASKGLPRQATVKFLAVGPKGLVYAALAKAGIYRSDDGGGSWRSVTGNLPLKRKEGWVSAVALHPTRAGTVFAVMAAPDGPSVWKSTNGGKRWAAQRKISYDPTNNPTRRWAADPTLAWWISFDPHDASRLFFTDFWSIQRSDDGGSSWADKIVGAQNTCVTSLTLDGETLLATHMDAGIMTSTDGGRTWRAVIPRVWDEKLAGHYWKLAIARIDGEKHYFTTMDPWSEQVGKVLHSTDGRSWRTVFSAKRPDGIWMSGHMLGLAVDPSDPKTLYVTQDGGKVHLTRDGGRKWRPAPKQPDDRSFTHALAVDHSGAVFAGTLNGGLWRSADHGRSWKRVLEEQGTIWYVVAAGKKIYASSGDDANLYLSSNSGKTWKRLTKYSRPEHGDETGNQGMFIAVDPQDPKHLLFSRVDTSHSADESAGIVESKDGGLTWNSANNGLVQKSASAIAFGRKGTLFAGTWGGGIWRRDR
jgi:photosystem II stability/assembly factor-like uncharacterized protein